MNRRQILQGTLGLASAFTLLDKATASSATPWLVERERGPKAWIGIMDTDGIERYHPRIPCLYAKKMTIEFYNKDGPIWFYITQVGIFKGPNKRKPITIIKLNQPVNRVERNDTLNLTINCLDKPEPQR